jgi:hypothetical protein
MRKAPEWDLHAFFGGGLNRALSNESGFPARARFRFLNRPPIWRARSRMLINPKPFCPGAVKILFIESFALITYGYLQMAVFTGKQYVSSFYTGVLDDIEQELLNGSEYEYLDRAVFKLRYILIFSKWTSSPKCSFIWPDSHSMAE